MSTSQRGSEDVPASPINVRGMSEDLTESLVRRYHSWPKISLCCAYRQRMPPFKSAASWRLARVLRKMAPPCEMMARSERLMFPLCNERVEMEKRILWGVILGVVVYAILGLVTDAREVASVLIEFPYLVFLGALGLTVVNYSVRFAKWHYYLRLLGLKVPVGLSLNVFLAGLVMSVTPGKLGEVLKSLLLREAQQIPAARTAPIVIAERLTDLLGLFVIAALGVGTFAFGRWAFAISVVVVVSAIIVLGLITRFDTA